MSTDPRSTGTTGEASQPTDAASAQAGVTAEPAPAAAPRFTLRRKILALIVGVIALDILAYFVIPPFPIGQPGKPVGGILDLIFANFERPAPHVVWDLAPNDPVAPGAIVSFHPSISAPLFTMWLVMAAIIVVAFLSTRGMRDVPGRAQNAIEFAWESLENWAIALGGQSVRRHMWLYTAFFLFILFSNWSGLLPIFGRIEALRAPTSDVNVTIGLALLVFVYFQAEGFRALGVRRYLGKFFPFGELRKGLGSGLIALYVGLIEFLLEFIKPVTLAMRLFGNIYGGEVALGVITSLTIALVPAALLLLEGLLNFVQALIFSTLMLIYTIIAVETHDEHPEPERIDTERGDEHPTDTSVGTVGNRVSATS